ncbi:MAG: hypothetical protein IT294_07395 [Deltaproteobacteria bacterium]|nr:hypothetical protein [Deltaproteobacteria bacterium]
MHKIVVSLLAVLLYSVWLRPEPAESVGPAFVFPLSVSGKAVQTDIAVGPGFKPTRGKVNDKIVAAILRGENASDYSVQFLDILGHDGSGRFYLYFDGRAVDGSVTMRIATNPSGSMTTALTGAITQDGEFWIAGKYDLPLIGPLADAFAKGKVKFAKGTFNPTKISGVVHFVSNAIGEGFTLKFKTIGGPLS